MWLTAAIVLATLLILAFGRAAPDTVLMGAVTVLLLTGILSPATAFAGFGNPGLVTVAALFIVSAGLVDTGAVHAIGARLLGKPVSLMRAQLRMMLPVTLVSSFLNNTPVVAMMVPTVAEWSRRCGWPVSKLMLPLSYAAILGGTCTLIGTSTNLIVAGLVLSSPALDRPLGFFEIAAIGVPVAVSGIAFILATSRWLLPDRTPPLSDKAAVREYAIEMLVDAGSPICGQTIEQAGLRNLPGAYLAEITRAETVIPAVTPNEVIQAGDRMLFVGNVITLTDLLRMRGLLPADDQLFQLDTPRAERSLVEAVLSEQSPAAGKTIRGSEFRRCYDA
ncbi:MAG: SLC13 family permease, partial [Gammaproteobacteria bacterium]|nr:SLC13 family permease [Gammaproteobacteria bacterium]